MSCYRFRVESARDHSAEESSLESVCDPFSSFGLEVVSATPFELWASSNSGSYSGASVHVSTLEQQSYKLFVEIRSSEPQFLKSSKAKRLAEELHCKYKEGFLCSALEP
jgi:hypothetical protein